MKVKLKNLVVDPTIWVRRKLNTHVSARYAAAMRQGNVFPPLVIDKMKRIVCGFHRYDAYITVYDENHAVECMVSKYTDDIDLIGEAFRENMKNGLQLLDVDQQHVTDIFLKSGITAEQASEILGISVKRIDNMGGRQIPVLGVDGIYNAPLKRGHYHMIGTGPVPEKDYNEHINHDLGVTPRFHMQKIIDILKRENWMPADEKTYATAQMLHAELTKYLDINMKGAVYETTKRAS